MDRLKSVYEKFYRQFPYYGNLLIIDLETTGFQKDARIIEIGAIAIKFDGLDVYFDTFESLINPGFALPTKITEVTGITDQDLENAPGDEKFAEFVEWLLNVNAKKCVAHNATFDKNKLEYNLYRTGNKVALPEFDCTMQLSKRNLKNVKNDQLKTLLEHFNFVNHQAHRALSDAEGCAYIYSKILIGEYK